jgi:IS5 family transposase
MRKNLLDQLPLTPVSIDHVRAAELAAMGDVLDQLAEAVGLVHEDLCWRGKRRVDPAKGRQGMAAEQVLRVGILKQHTGASYEGLSFALADSSTYRSFCRLGFDQKPLTKSALQKNVKRVKPETWDAIQRMVVRKAHELGVEKGDKVRTDCMVVESNIHHPTDSSLLGDCVRVLTRLMKNARQRFGLRFTSHRLRAKRRVLEISNAKSMTERTPLYRDLLKMTQETVEQAEQIAHQLDQVNCETITDIAVVQAIAGEIRYFVPLANQVLSQTERRVLRGESVPATEKIVSIFQPHTDLIIKDNRETEYGHKICLTTGASSLVTDIIVEKGNPADSTLAAKMIKRQKDIFGKAPKQASFDGGFATRANLAEIKALGVTDTVFHKRRGIEIEQMARSKGIYKRLRAFRAGIEGTISFLKRTFGLERCTWSGFDSFRAYVYASTLACNLLVIARHVLAARV